MSETFLLVLTSHTLAHLTSLHAPSMPISHNLVLHRDRKQKRPCLPAKPALRTDVTSGPETAAISLSVSANRVLPGLSRVWGVIRHMLISSHAVIRGVRSPGAATICTRCGWKTSYDNLCRDGTSLLESLAMGSSSAIKQTMR